MEKYKCYRISPDNTGYVNFVFFISGDDLISGHGKTITECKEQIDELVNN